MKRRNLKRVINNERIVLLLNFSDLDNMAMTDHISVQK
jgi:hypothetical protein